jgi:hypothetical protein
MDTINNQVYYRDSNRLGKFSIRDEILNDGAERPWLGALFAMCVVIASHPDESGRGREFIAACKMFEPLVEGEEIPRYRIECESIRPFTEDERARATASCGVRFYAVRNHIVRAPLLAIHVGARSPHLH